MKRLAMISFCLILTALPCQASQVGLVKVEEIISPAVLDLIQTAITQSQKYQAECLIIELDTPGGLATSMQKIVKTILNSPIPIVVYVGPSGAKAASAGAIITLAAHIASMAPGTNIGAAHPVNLGGKHMSKEMSRKIVNDMVAYVRSIAAQRHRNGKVAAKMVTQSISLTAKEALKAGIIDLIANNLQDLLNKINGYKVKLAERTKVLHTKDAQIVVIKGGIRYDILRVLSNPNIAYLLMMLGLAGLYFEIAHPGVILPGVVGAISLVLAFLAFQTLPVNYAGVLLIILGVICFILELKVTSYGLLTIAAIFCYTLGSIMLFHQAPGYLHISLTTLIPTLIFVSLFFIGVVSLVVKAQKARVKSGLEGLIGQTAQALTDIIPGQMGKVFVHGEIWNALSSEEIKKGSKAVIVDVEGLKLKVKSQK